ncbi:hypothetical protein [Salinicoccus roseus]|uniref:O-antigen ligase-like membrane protein n=1 Tax=Salinicoccus roseus TaxID=45670 RepID=A0ABT4YF88_9STAP|nr:hypothetical protein [Salinicoccus roseus]MDB0579482.1 hypothetical protein [Salinicoccus roseus]
MDLKKVYNAAIISLVIQFALLVTLESSSMRAVIFFNNPNQLAYFSLSMITLVVLLSFSLRLSIFQHFFPYIIVFPLIFMSGSRGAFFAIVFLLISHYLLVKFSWKKVIILLFTSGFIYTLITFRNYIFMISPELFNIYNRLFMKYDRDDILLSDRGYSRIIENSEFWIFGAGEGYSNRLNYSLELHSLFGTIFFSYGIIGAVVFLLSFVRISFMMKSHLILLGGIAIYNISHNGIRSTLVWIIISFILVAYKKERK